MFLSLLHKVFGTRNDRILKKLKPTIKQINDLESEMKKLSDEELAQRTEWFKKRFQEGETLDDLLVEAFATVREGAMRSLGMRHFDVQLQGGIILHRGIVAEMATGEGKTLMATLPTYLNALSGKGVHVVTVNDYLASRDSDWMGEVYRFLGLTVGCITNNMEDEERRDAYNCDITYGTNNEFGFDYLRDNMKFSLSDMVQRDFNYAIVDEVDSILIDEARTPLIISGPAEDSSELYIQSNKVIPKLTEDDYEKDEKARAVTLTEQGSQKIEGLLGEIGLLKSGSLYDIQNINLVHHVNQALKAHVLFTKDVDYIVKDRKVIIIDEFTGRMMEGRRFSEGLHQALEAKEGVDVQIENQTLASTTFQNYFRLYDKLAGMTGTAKTEAAELADIYGLDVLQVQTNLPMARIDHDDEVYRTEREKIKAIIEQVKECHSRKQPVLVGTTSIEKSEEYSQFLTKNGIQHNVLNARKHQEEAIIIAQAGRPGAVTLATNMAGRGTDIKLGGNIDLLLADALAKTTDESKKGALEKELRAQIEKDAASVKASGGLYVIGTERHESRRIDNQLRGRSGRQGDPGNSKFFISLEDNLMRIFSPQNLDSMLKKLGLEEGEAIIHPWINKAIERAQQKVEARNYDVRKFLLKYDNVMNDQRKVIYEQRRDIMGSEDIQDVVLDMREEVLDDMIARFIPEGAYPEQWDVGALHEECLRIFNLDLPIKEWSEEEGIADVELRERIDGALREKMDAKEETYGAELMRIAEKSILLRLLDQSWKDHLLGLESVRQGINLRAYGQRDPLNEYKQESFSMFEAMLARVRETITATLSHLEIQAQTSEEIEEATLDDAKSSQQKMQTYKPGFGDENGGDDTSSSGGQSIKKRLNAAKKNAGKGKPTLSSSKKKSNEQGAASVSIGEMPAAQGVNRNALCPCGSGKRFKHCCGRT